MIFRAFLLVSLTAAAAVSGQALAQQYRWVDDKGRVQFGDVVPPGAKQVRKTTAADTAKPGMPVLNSDRPLRARIATPL